MKNNSHALKEYLYLSHHPFHPSANELRYLIYHIYNVVRVNEENYSIRNEKISPKNETGKNKKCN